jgi:hypothetical protein
MEMIFNSEEGIITSSEEIKFILDIDEILYYPLDFESVKEIKKYPYSELLHGYIYLNNDKKEIKFIIPNINYDEDDIMLNKNNLVEMKDLRLFVRYYNFYKYCYYYNIHSFFLLNKAQKNINSKELYLNMDLYITNKYFNEISSKMQSYKSLYSSFLTVTQNKFKKNKLIELLFSISNNEKKENDELSIVIDLKSLFSKIYDELIEKENQKNKNKIERKKSDNIYVSNEYHIEDIYALLRWMMEHFQDLRMKDNMDLANKRIRCNEYIASLLTKEFSRKLNRIIALGDKVTIDNFKELFK